MERGALRYKRALEAIAEWTHEYGRNLCPGARADTYGEGIRAAKAQVRAILERYESGERGSDGGQNGTVTQ